MPKTLPKTPAQEKPRVSHEAIPTRPAHHDLWISLVLCLATFGVYAQVRHFDFVNFDDPQYVSDNVHVRNGLTQDGIAWAFTSGDAANWFPLTRLSEMLDCQIFGLRSGWHHFTNVVFHALAALLLFAFLHRATHARWPSAFVAFLFALHPLHVESVAWVAERKDVLSALFWFLALWSYVHYAELHAANSRREGLRWYLATLVAFSFGLMSKPMIVTLPFVLLLLDLWPLHRMPVEKGAPLRVWPLVREKVPFLLLSAVAAIVTYFVQRGTGAVVALVSVPLGLRLENALVSYVVYIARMFWPANLAVFYPYPAVLPAWQAVLAGLALAGITILVLRWFPSHPYLAVGWLWYLGTLAPVIGLMQVGSQARADRYMYVPMVGIAIMLAWAASDLVARWPRVKPVAIALAAVACVGCTVLTPIQVQYWRNSESLFRHALDVTSGNYLAHYNLGVALSANPKRIPEAVREYEAALRIRPDYAEASNNLGAALSNNPDRLPEIIADYRAALRISPNLATAHNNLGNALSKMPGRLPEAISEYEAAIRIQPDYAEAHNNLGIALSSIPGRISDSIAEYEAAIRLKPDYATAHYNLGNAYAKLPGRLPDAIAEYQAALRIQPDYAEAHINLASALAQVPGRLPDAIAEYQAVLRVQPDYAEVYFNLGNLLSSLPGRLPEAIGEYQTALRIRPDYAEAHANLGAALARTPGRLPEGIAHFEAALRLRPDLAEVHYNLAVALLKMPGRVSEAITHFEAVQRIRPDPDLQKLLNRLRAGK